MPARRESPGQREAWEDASERMKREQDALERMWQDIEHRNAHRGDAEKRIRRLLDIATGQKPEQAKVCLREIVTIAREGAAPPGWREMVEAEYPQLVSLL